MIDENRTARQLLLAEAEGLVCGDRNYQYGPPTQDFDRIAALWTILFDGKLKSGEAFSNSDVALAMVALKLSRLSWRRKFDSWVDVAGYAACGWECDES